MRRAAVCRAEGSPAKYGLTAKGMQMDLAALAEVKSPAILFWEFNHYVVYDGMGRRFGRRGV